MSTVVLFDVSAGYGGEPVLTGLSLDVHSGEFLAVLGASGSGKTTMLRILAGFLRPASGVVSFGERELSGPATWVPPEQRRVGMVPQEGALFPHLTVGGNVEFGLPRALRGTTDSRTRVAELLDLVGLPGMERARPQELSGGQQQRVALARALAPRPDVLLLDEPFSALDAGLRVRLRSEVRALLKELGTTTLLVTHDQEEALSIADRVAVMHRGCIEQVATPDELYARPASLAVARFVGEHAELSATKGADGTAHCALGLIPLEQTDHSSEGTRGLLLLRPEQLMLTPYSEAPEGVVVGRSLRGPDVMLAIDLATQDTVPVRVPRHESPPIGAQVRVSVQGSGRFFGSPNEDSAPRA